LYTPFPTQQQMRGSDSIIWVCNTEVEIPREVGNVVRITPYN